MNTITSQDGTRIAFDKTGKGPALVLVDGAFCFREHGVSPRLVPLLANHFTVYSYDRRGRGQSTDTLPYAVDREIEDLMAIVAVTNETPFICAISSGAVLLLRALDKGLPVKKIALFEPPFVVNEDTDRRPPINAAIILEQLVNENKRSEAVHYFMTRVMGVPAVFIFLFRLFARKSWTKNESVANTLSYDVQIMGDFRLPKEMVLKINMPALVIGGDKSPKKLREAVVLAGKTIPGAITKFLKGQNHNVQMSALAPELTGFFKDQSSSISGC